MGTLALLRPGDYRLGRIDDRWASGGLEFARQLDDQCMVESLRELGVTLQALGHPEQARAHWLEALAILERLQTTDADQVRVLLAELPAAPTQPEQRAMKARAPEQEETATLPVDNPLARHHLATPRPPGDRADRPLDEPARLDTALGEQPSTSRHPAVELPPR